MEGRRVRRFGTAVGQEQPAVVEEHDAVAQQAPALFGVAGNDVGRPRAISPEAGHCGSWMHMVHLHLAAVDWNSSWHAVAVQYGRTRPDGVRVSIQHHHGTGRGVGRRIRICCILLTSSLAR